MGLDAAIGSTYNYLAPVFNSMITSFYDNDIPTAQKHMVTAQNAINTAFRIGATTDHACTGNIHIHQEFKFVSSYPVNSMS